MRCPLSIFRSDPKLAEFFAKTFQSRSLVFTGFTVWASNSAANRLRLYFLDIVKARWKTTFLWDVHFFALGDRVKGARDCLHAQAFIEPETHEKHNAGKG
jgi:hypothetical protein